MKHTHERDFGRPIPAVQTVDIIDKWDALTELTDAAEDFGICHRSLTVLRALLSFLPTRSIDPTPLGAIVFPSNKTIATRLNGMPESTLRRHLSRLVSVGIVSRRDSANRKRFARAGQGGLAAFGLDLSPLARFYAQIKSAAEAQRARREALDALRAEVAALRAALLLAEPLSTLCEDARRLLRRKPVESDLKAMQNLLATALSPPEMSTSDSQNERHIQTENKTISEPVKTGAQKKETATQLDVLGRCKEYQCFFPKPVSSDRDLFEIANALAPMVGIDPPVFKEAVQTMGAIQASLVVICLLERLTTLDNPGGYLRHLTKEARAGRFELSRFWAETVRQTKLSADNPKYGLNSNR